jgi:hypothetical protein
LPGTHAPALATDWPCDVATDVFQYVTPSQPQTGVSSAVSTPPLGMHVPCLQPGASQYMPGPQGSTAAHVQALLPEPVLLPLPVEVAEVAPPEPPWPLDVALAVLAVPLVVVPAPPLPVVVVVAAPPPLLLPVAAVSPVPLQPQTAASAAAGARNTIEDHRMKSSVPRRVREETETAEDAGSASKSSRRAHCRRSPRRHRVACQLSRATETLPGREITVRRAGLPI